MYRSKSFSGYTAMVRDERSAGEVFSSINWYASEGGPGRESVFE